MPFTHHKTQSPQCFQVISENQAVGHDRRWGPSFGEHPFGELGSPVSGRTILELAYRISLSSLRRESKHQSIPYELPSLPSDNRLMNGLSREQQALISDWLDEEISIYLTQSPNRSMSVYEHLGDLSARWRALANNKAP